MDEIKIQSNTIDTVSYYYKTMFVKTKDGKMLSYNGVTKELFDDFTNSDNHDDFYENVISNYTFQRMV